MALRIIRPLLIVAAMGLCAPSVADDSTARLHRVTGEKLDSGLGSLPHYREWRDQFKPAAPVAAGRINPVLGEKLDSGLGELPRYSGPPRAVHTASR